MGGRDYHGGALDWCRRRGRKGDSGSERVRPRRVPRGLASLWALRLPKFVDRPLQTGSETCLSRSSVRRAGKRTQSRRNSLARRPSVRSVAGACRSLDLRWPRHPHPDLRRTLPPQHLRLRRLVRPNFPRHRRPTFRPNHHFPRRLRAIPERRQGTQGLRQPTPALRRAIRRLRPGQNRCRRSGSSPE
jgi:hypothetical protein